MRNIQHLFRSTPRRSIQGITAATALMLIVPGAATAASATTSASSGTAATASQKLPAYLQGYRQAQMLCPGGPMVGKVSTAIIDPMNATRDAPGDCTLSDMKSANPGTRFLAYIDIGAMRPAEEWNGVFKNSCADPTTPEGARFAVRTDNPRVAKNEHGFATFPAFQYLTVADLSPEYAEACAATAKTILTTDSEKGTTDAPAARFDGIFLDDASMSPSHGQDMVNVGQWGPWSSDDDYGRSLNKAVSHFDATLDASMGKEIPVAVNLGVYPSWDNQVNLAKELARTKSVDFALREHTVTDGNGKPQTLTAIKEATAANRAITAAGMPVVEHDYSVSLRELPSSSYGRGMEISPSASCLLDSSPNRSAIVSAAGVRRILDHRMTLGHTLMTRTNGTKAITATLSQAEAHCQDNAWDDDRNWENVTKMSVNSADSQVTEMTSALNSGVHALTYGQTASGVQIAKLSNGKRLVVNPTNITRSVVISGIKYTVYGRSALMK